MWILKCSLLIGQVFYGEIRVFWLVSQLLKSKTQTYPSGSENKNTCCDLAATNKGVTEAFVWLTLWSPNIDPDLLYCWASTWHLANSVSCSHDGCIWLVFITVPCCVSYGWLAKCMVIFKLRLFYFGTQNLYQSIG